jgi:hypothetical protein
MPAAWLWPDRKIGKRESRRLRDEHNATVNAIVITRDALRRVIDGCLDGDHSLSDYAEELRAALAVCTKTPVA